MRILAVDASTSYPTRNTLDWSTAFWALAAAFGTYFCMYAFRKPFTAAPFAGLGPWGIGYKEWLVSSQVIGYTISKFVGIKVVSELPASRRAVAILLLIALAEFALLLFAIVPKPWGIACLFLNGLPLGMVFGLVLGFLEGRNLTEFLAAGLCASFILADGFTKSAGRSLFDAGVDEHWMPFMTGLCFSIPLIIFVGMLARIPAPNQRDVQSRVERMAMSRQDRVALFRKYAAGLSFLIAIYLLLTIIRSIRGDFADRIWDELGVEMVPSTFTISELWIALGVLAASSFTVLFKDHRWVFFLSLAICALGFLVMIGALVGRQMSWLSPLAYMVLIGLGTYLPYVMIHTTVFERLIAMNREVGTLAFLMYLADAYGYLGYVAVMLTKNMWREQINSLWLLESVCWTGSLFALFALGFSAYYFSRKPPSSPKLYPTSPTSP
jgi:hypothetical protein